MKKDLKILDNAKWEECGEEKYVDENMVMIVNDER